MKTTTAFFVLLVTLTSVAAQQHADSLIVFVGRKISLVRAPWAEKELPVDTIVFNGVTTYNRAIPFDSRYRAVYTIEQLLHGAYRKPTIEFTVFDHYGEPAFSKYETVLLFVSYQGGKLYHEKYQYFALYPTKNGRLASPYAAGIYNNTYNIGITVRPERIRFEKEVSFPLDKLTDKEIAFRYPAPYYVLKNGRAIAVYGHYVDDLFTLQKQTVLKARGYFTQSSK